MKAFGYAVAQDGAIDVKTVSPTRVAAMVNWLHVKAGITCDNGVADDVIENLFNRYAHIARVISVSIVESL